LLLCDRETFFPQVSRFEPTDLTELGILGSFPQMIAVLLKCSLEFGQNRFRPFIVFCGKGLGTEVTDTLFWAQSQHDTMGPLPANPMMHTKKLGVTQLPLGIRAFLKRPVYPGLVARVQARLQSAEDAINQREHLDSSLRKAHEEPPGGKPLAPYDF
jgi:hypothetical protein